MEVRVVRLFSQTWPGLSRLRRGEKMNLNEI